MEDFQSNTINSVSQIEDYIEFINLQLKNPNTQDIPITNGTFIEFWNEYPIYSFEINLNNAKKLENLRGDYWIEINDQRKECNLVDISDRHISIWIKDNELDTKNTIRNASIKVDLSFVLKRQLIALEQLKHERYETIRKYLFAGEDIPNSYCADCTFESSKLNEEQKDAIRFGVGVKDFYLIWGPPGTGKTTVIPEMVLNFRRNYLKDTDKEPRVLICSWTNAAVDNVAKVLFGKIEKMVRYGETSLRKKEYRDTYKSILFEEQVESKKNELVREFDKKVKKIKNETSTIQDKINSDEEQLKLLKERNDLISSKKASIENEISAIQCQIEQYDEQLKLLKDRRESFSSKYDNIDKQITTLKERIVLEEHIFSTSIFRKIFRRSKYKEKMIEMRDQLNKLLSQKNELFIEIQNIEHSIISHHSECLEKIPELQNQASKLLSPKNELIAEMKYDEQSISALELSIAQNKENLKIIKNEYYKLQEDKNLALKNIEVKVLKENFTILTTNLRTSNNIFETINFDIVIMDEAGAIDLPSAAIVLTRSSKVVFLGDHKQLPPIIQENSLEVRTFLRRNPKIKRSIFEVLYKNYYQKDRLILLENQYRMKKEIADFISTQFYGGRIKSPSEIHGILKNTNDKILSVEYPVILLQRNFKTEYKGGKSAYNLSEMRLMQTSHNSL